MATSRREPPTTRTPRRKTRNAEPAGQESGAAAREDTATAAGEDAIAGDRAASDKVAGLEAGSPPAQDGGQAARPDRVAAVDPRSLVFDPAWYLSQYSDVASARLDPAQHFLENGCFEGRDPNPYFSTRFYCENNPDVVESGMNPFLHYVMHGAREGRLPREQD